MKKLLGSLLALSLLAGCGVQGSQGLTAAQRLGAMNAKDIGPLAPELPRVEGERPATLFSYIAMDDGLTGFATTYLKSIELSATSRIHDVAFADFKGKDNSYLFYLQPTSRAVDLTSPKSFLNPATKEVTSNDPAVLAATTEWAFSTYPAPFKAMDIFAHGGGYLGQGTDAKPVPGSAHAIMTVSDVGNALRTGLKGQRLQLLNTLSCMMGNVEYAYELSDVADVLIASEDSIYATNDSTNLFTAELNKQLSGDVLDAKAIGAHMVEFADSRSNNSGYKTISAVDLTKMDALAGALKELSGVLVAAMPTQGDGILKAYDMVPNLDLGEFGNRDLWVFCTRLGDIKDPAITRAATHVKAALKASLIATNDREGRKAYGLSISLPRRFQDMVAWKRSPVFQASLNSKFYQATGWGEFLNKVYYATYVK